MRRKRRGQPMLTERTSIALLGRCKFLRFLHQLVQESKCSRFMSLHLTYLDFPEAAIRGGQQPKQKFVHVQQR